MKNIKSFLVLTFVLALTRFASAQNDLPMPLNIKAAFDIDLSIFSF